MLSKREQNYIISLKLKKFRTLENKFLVEGLKNITELLHSNIKLELLICAESFANQFSKFNPIVVDKKTLNKLSTLTTNETALAVAKIPNYDIETIDFDEHLFVFDHISDPGNLGTIIRTLDWFGYKQIICSLGTTEFFSPKTITSSMGSFTRIKPFYLDLNQFLQNTTKNIFGLTLNGKLINEVKINEPSIFILGSESHGISQEVQKYIHSKITIPCKNKNGAESLNVAIATSILAYQLTS